MGKSNLEIIVGLTDKASKNAQGIASAFGDIAKIATGILAADVFRKIGRGIIDFARGSISEASNLNEALNATSVVFGEAADKVQEFGRIAAQSAGLSASEFNQMGAEIGAMLVNFGIGLDTAATETINLTQRAADMASIYNTDVATAMDAIKSGLAGMPLPLRRFGVELSQVVVNAKALELGFKRVDGQFDQTALTAARMALIFEQTDVIAGDFVKTSDQLANMTRVQEKEFANFKAELGANFLPVIEKLRVGLGGIATVIFPRILEVAAPLADSFMRIADQVTVFAMALINGTDPLLVLNDGLRNTIQNILSFVDPIMTAIESFVTWQDVLIALGIVIMTAVVPAIISMVVSAAPILLTIAALIAVVALLRNAWQKDWLGIRTALTDFWTNTGSPVFETLKQWLSVNIPIAIEALKRFWENVLLPAIQAVYNWISGVLIPFFSDSLIPMIRDRITQAIQNLKNFWTDVLLPAIQAVWSFIETSLLPLFRSLVDFFDAAFALALTALAGLWQNVLQPALKAVGDYVGDKLQPVFQALEKFWSNIFGPALERVKINVLDKLKGVFDGIRNAIGWVTDELEKMTAALRNIKLPAWLTPGSPTPFELGLRGINDALKQLNQQSWQDLSISAARNVGNGAAMQGQVVNNNYYLTAQYPMQSQTSLAQDVQMLQLLHGA